MKQKLYLIIAILLFFSSLAVQASVYTIEATSSYVFTPNHVNAVVGDTIRWIWTSGAPHTTTSTSVPTNAATWDGPLDSTHRTFAITLTVPGQYTYASTPDDTILSGNGMTGSITVTTTATGISTVAKANASLNVSPNPIKSSLNISFNSPKDALGVVKIYDLTGKEVYSEQVQVATGANTMALKLSNLNSGMYIAEVTVGTERIGSRRISKD